MSKEPSKPDAPRKIILSADEPVGVPMSEFVEWVATTAARAVVEEHLKTCPALKAANSTSQRLRMLEMRYQTLIGLMLGSGVSGGMVVVGVRMLLGW